MQLKDKLASLDPQTLEPGPSTDALVAEILGEPEPQEKATVASHFMAHRFWNTRIVVPESSDGECGYAWHPVDISKSPGLAFEVLWPWLDNRTNILILRGRSLNTGVGDGPDYVQLFDKVQPIHFCRAVVAVAKARNR